MIGTIWDWIKWALILPVWKVLLGVVVIGLVVTAGILLKFTFGTVGGDRTKPVPDDHGDVVLPTFDKRLDAFRANWNIRGDFRVWPTLLPLAEMSSNAYHLEPDAKQDFKSFGFNSLTLVESPFHSQVAYIAKGEDVLVVVFRGTDDTEDWFTNANMYLRKMAEGEIHSGFSGAYGMLRMQILQEITKANPKYLWITGHSLGGALALVCAYDLTQYQDREINGIITFGQPMICTATLAGFLQKKLGDRYVHFVNELDAVPQVPLGFSHCGLMLRFYRGKVQKSKDYFEVLMKSGPDGNDQDEIEFEPIQALPPISPDAYQEFMQNYDGEKHPNLSAMLSSPPQHEPPNGQPIVARAIPWKADHSMDLYVEKIKAAIDKAAGH